MRASLKRALQANQCNQHALYPHHGRLGSPRVKAARLSRHAERQGVGPCTGLVRQAQAAAEQSISTFTRIGTSGLPRAATIGILGGGQLGKMLAMEAVKMGVRVKVLDPTPDCPAAAVAEQVVGSFRDAEAVRRLAADVDVLTVEIEHVDADALEAVGLELDIDVEPTPHTLRLIQDKLVQKRHFQRHGIPVAASLEVADAAAARHATDTFGFPLMLKSRRLAYDGRGNAVVKSAEAMSSAVESLGGYGHGLYAERWAPYVKELAVMVVRSRGGNIRSYPVVETLHRDSICHTTEAPALVPKAIERRARQVAEKAAACLEGAGVFGVEMFLLADGMVLLNEVAPRPHNSGHYTIEACATSQYEQHLRAVLGWPLGETGMVVGASIMLNILGEAHGDLGMKLAHELMGRAFETPGASVHWYGKHEVSEQRKVGHITVVAPDNFQARQRLRWIEPRAADALEATASDAAATGLIYVPDSEFGERYMSSWEEDQVEPSEGGGAPAAPRVGIIMGSDSDLATMRGAAEALELMAVPCEVTVVSAHRTPDRMMEYARTAHARGLRVLIAGAGGAAHLPGMVAALTPLPVIGVPVKPAGAHLDGIDALLSIVQMPKGVPVATVAIGNATNAGLLAARILAASDQAVLDRMVAYQDDMRSAVMSKAARLESQGWQQYRVG